jgi:hypothetical protein
VSTNTIINIGSIINMQAAASLHHQSSFFTHTHTQAITCIDTAQVGGLVAAGDASGTITIYRLRPFLSRTKAELLEQVYTTNLAGFG